MGDNAKGELEKQRELAPLLDAFVQVEAAVKDTQLGLRCQIAETLPALPPPADQVSTRPAARCESQLCLWSATYAGLAERSLCLMGETSLYALLVQAYDLVNLRVQTHQGQQLGFDKIILLHKLREELKEGERDLVQSFEHRLSFPFAAMQHHGKIRASLEQKLAESPGLLTDTMAEATAVYKSGLQKVKENLPPLLCAEVFLAMEKVKQILRTGDRFYELSTGSGTAAAKKAAQQQLRNESLLKKIARDTAEHRLFKFAHSYISKYTCHIQVQTPQGLHRVASGLK